MFLLFALMTLAAGTRPAVAQLLAFRLLNEDNGLSNSGVEAMAQDRAGFLYVGTENGLYGYDGNRFNELGPRDGLPSKGHVESLQAAPGGGVWVVLADRVYLYGAGDTVSAALDLRADDERGHRTAMLGDDLLLVRNHHLLRVHVGPDRLLSVHPVVTDVLIPRNPGQAAPVAGLATVHVEHGNIWLGCGLSICRLDKAGMTVMGAAAGLPEDHWIGLLRDHAGTLWLRSPRRIASLAPAATRFVVVDVPGGPGRFETDIGEVELVEDAAGRVVTQSASGLLVHEKDRWLPFERAENIPFRRIRTMLVDREGSLWLGSRDNGVARMIGFGTFENWTRMQGLSDNVVWSVSRDGAGTLWVATDVAVEALAERDRPPQSLLRAGLPPASPAPVWQYPSRAFALTTSLKGWLWIGQRKGSLVRRAPETGQSQVLAQLDLIRTLLPDPAGAMWIGTHRGLAWIDHPDDAAAPSLSGILPDMGRVFAMTFDAAGEIWVLGEKALYHRNALKQWHSILQTDPEGGYMTRSMAFATDGTLWLGSFTTGITRLHLDHDVVVGSDRQPSEHLASQEVEMLRRDPAGLIWVGTDHGLDVTDGRRWRHVDDQDGLPSNDIDENAMFSDRDGTSWFGNAGGLSHLIDARRLFSPMSLHPIVTGISVGGRDFTPAQMQAGALHLQWSHDPLVISFASLDFRFEKSVRFRYRLLGVDRGWVETTAHEVRYPDAPAGRLVFELIALDPVHRVQSSPVQVTLKIHPPWWRTWPVSAGVVILSLGLLALLWRLRIGYLLVRQRQLEALVAERTQQIEQARLILFKQATFDALTGLLNRPAVLERLRLAMHEAALGGAPLGVALLDLDNFKKVNDRFGHLGGDAVLSEAGRRLSASTRDGDQAGRYGGEELLLVLPGLRQDAFERIEALRDAVFQEPFVFEDDLIRMTCSMGVTWMQVGDDVTAMIRRADAALYVAKHGGRDRVVFDPPQDLSWALVGE